MAGIEAQGVWPGRFNRFILPGLAFKAVVIGGGYATGRELAEFFLPSGSWGGLFGMLLAMAVWSIVCAISFIFTHMTASHDYDTFFRNLLGRLSPVCELAYAATLVLVLSVFGATAGAIGAALLGAPVWLGTAVLGVSIALVVAGGEGAVERLFKYVSAFLYSVYGLFLALSVWRFSGRIAQHYAVYDTSAPWVQGGLTYASYNLLGAVAILPVLRHLTSRRDAVVAGLIAGPLAMLPAIVFFVCMTAFAPGIGRANLPSDILLAQLQLPLFRFVFQAMIFSAILEGGTAAVQSIIARSGKVFTRAGLEFSATARLGVAACVLISSMLIAEKVGLVLLIARGYRYLAVTFLLIYILPLLTVGLYKIFRDAPTRASRPSQGVG